MLKILSEVLPEAIAIAFNPVAVITVILLLTGQYGKPKAIAYIAGWVVGLLTISVAIYFLMETDYGLRSLLAPHIPTLQFLLALQFLGLAIYQLFLVIQQKQGKPPRNQWFNRLNKLSLLQVFFLAITMAGFSVKNVGLVLSAGSSMLRSGFFGFSSWIIFSLFIFLGSAPIIFPVVYAVLRDSQAEARLTQWRDWLLANNAMVMFILFVILGIKLLRTALSGI